MKKILCVMVLGILSLSIVGCGKNEQNTGEKNTHDIPVETNSSDEAYDEQAYDTEEVTITPQMEDREIDSSLQIGNTVLEMPITYTGIKNVPDIEMYTDEDRTVPAIDTFLVEADDDKKIYCSIYGTNFTINMKNISESDLDLNECMILDVMDIDGPGIVLPGNVQFGKTDLRTLKKIFGDNIGKNQGGWHIYAGKTYPYNNPIGKYQLLPITGNKYSFKINESTQLVTNIWWKVNDWTKSEQVIKVRCSGAAYSDISIIIEDGWNPYCDIPNSMIYELFKTTAGNEYVIRFDLKIFDFNVNEIGRNDIDSSEFVKYESDTEFDYSIAKGNANNFILGLYNDTTSFTGYFVEVQPVTDITDDKTITELGNLSDLDEILNHLIDVLKTAQISAK